jgi:hypothetical protein
MAKAKNSDRRKRKYSDKQKSRCARNKVTKKAAAERRAARLIARSAALADKRVRYGTQDGRPLIGRVIGVLSPGDEGYPVLNKEDKDERKAPRGTYLVIEDRPRDKITTRARRRVKPV